MSNARVAAELAGRRAEDLAALLLAIKGYRILARRFQAPGGEIDIAARRGGLLVFVEVKARASVDDAVLAVSRRARRRIEAAGRSFLAKRPHLARLDIRYDIIAVRGWRPTHVRDAWRGGE